MIYHGELSNSQKEPIITLIEKDKDKRDLSKAIAKRLENVLQNIIHFNQSAYVKGSTIFHAVRTTEDVMEFSEIQYWRKNGLYRF